MDVGAASLFSGWTQGIHEREQRQDAKSLENKANRTGECLQSLHIELDADHADSNVKVRSHVSHEEIARV